MIDQNTPAQLPGFVLVALPGTGKTTACHTIANTWNESKLSNVGVLSVDNEIKQRISPNDPVIVNFMKQHPEVDKNIFVRPKEAGAGSKDVTGNRVSTKGFSVSAKIMQTYGEGLWRALEADFCVDILQKAGPDIIDLGGKMFLKDSVREATQAQSIRSIFLYANLDTIEEHLAEKDNWSQRSNYRLAGERGWRGLLHQHARERTPAMIELTDIAIDVTAKRPETVARDILFRLYEYNTLRMKDKKSYGVQI